MLPADSESKRRPREATTVSRRSKMSRSFASVSFSSFEGFGGGFEVKVEKAWKRFSVCDSRLRAFCLSCAQLPEEDILVLQILVEVI